MKRLREYLNEDFDPAIFNHDGGISIDDPTVVDALNSNLEMATAGSFRTPYNALEEVRKVLAYYKIFLPKSVFLDQTDGNDVFQISQFGEKTGMNDKGEVVTADDSSLFVYFEWSINEKGLYDTFACVCNQEELDDVLDDFESEVEEELQEEMSPAEVSKLMYKVKNAMMSDEHKALVKSYMAKAISEQQMPDLKKKMGAKKVTLPNMMRKEEKQSDWSKDMKKQRKYAKKKLTPKAKAARDAAAKETINEVSKEKLKKYVKGAKADRDLAISDREHYKSNLKDPDKAWTKGIPHKDSQYKMAVDRNARAMKRAKGIAQAEKKLASEDYDPNYADLARHAKKFYDNPSKVVASNARKIYKKHNKKATTGMDEEAINEISGEKARKAEHKSAKDYYDKYDAETKARGKYIKSKDPKDKAKADDAKEKRTKAAKRTIRFQQYADKKLNEVSAKLAKNASDKADVAANSAWTPNASDKTKKYIKRKEKQSMKFANYMHKKLKEDYPGVQRRSNKTLDPDLQQKFKDYKSDQQAKHSSNMVKMSYQNSPNQTFKTMGQAMPWKSTDSRAKYDATRDKIVDTQNQREIRRDPPITVKEETELDRWKRKYDERKKEMGHDYVNVLDKPPFDKPTEKPSTPYKNPKAKAKQLARAAMKKALADKNK